MQKQYAKIMCKNIKNFHHFIRKGSKKQIHGFILCFFSTKKYQKPYKMTNIHFSIAILFMILLFLHKNIHAQVDNFPQNTEQKINERVKKQLDSLLKIKLDSIVNIAKHKPKTTVQAFQYRFLGDGFTMQGNVNRILVTHRLEIAYTKNKFQFEANPRFVYGEQNTNLAERDFFSDASVNFFHSKKLYLFGLGTYEFSNLRGILNRYLGGIGAGWRVFHGENIDFSLTNAFIYESTDFLRRTDFATWRNSTRIKLKYNLTNPQIRFVQYIFLQPSIQDADNFRWNMNFLAEMPLHKGFSCRVSVDNFYESVIFDNRQQNDLTFRFGFSWGNRQ